MFGGGCSVVFFLGGVVSPFIPPQGRPHDPAQQRQAAEMLGPTALSSSMKTTCRTEGEGGVRCVCVFEGRGALV